MKEKLEQRGQLLDVLDVVEEAMTFNLFNTPTDNPNDEMDNADMEMNLIAEEVEKNAIMNEINTQSGDENMETMANGSPRCRIFYCCCCVCVCLLLVFLLHACVFWVLLLLHAYVLLLGLCVCGVSFFIS